MTKAAPQTYFAPRTFHLPTGQTVNVTSTKRFVVVCAVPDDPSRLPWVSVRTDDVETALGRQRRARRPSSMTRAWVYDMATGLER